MHKCHQQIKVVMYDLSHSDRLYLHSNTLIGKGWKNMYKRYTSMTAIMQIKITPEKWYYAQQNISWNVACNVLYVWTSHYKGNSKTACSLSELADDVFIANIRLNAFMSLYVSLKVIFVAEFLLTNVTCEPSAFIVRLQQCFLSWGRHAKLSEQCLHEYLFATVWTLHFCDCRKLLSTVRTGMRSYIAVYTSFMSPQVARWGETFVAHRTLVWFISSVDSQVNG